MTMENRAAQFAPFAALTTHGSAIAETARLTTPKRILSDDEQQTLSRRLSFILDRLDEKPDLRVMHFIRDSLKSGGLYAIHTGIIRKFDEYERHLIFTDGTVIRLDDILSIDGEIFDGLE